MKTHKNNIGNVQDTITEPKVYHEKYAKKVVSKLYAYIYLKNSDKTKYDSILKNLNQQNSFRNNQYPKSITEANSILNNHKFDRTYLNKNKNNIPDNEDAPLSLTFTQIESRCYYCGKSGHKSPQCRFKDKPKNKWCINKLQFTQKNKENKEKNENTTEDTEETSTYSRKSTITSKSNPKPIGWTNLHYNLSYYNQSKPEIMKNLVFLGSDSTNTILPYAEIGASL